jgi:hypothetical protein
VQQRRHLVWVVGHNPLRIRILTVFISRRQGA